MFCIKRIKILNIEESKLIFLPKPDYMQAQEILMTSIIDKLFKINTSLRELCNFVWI